MFLMKKKSKYVHFAVEVSYTDGPFTIATTQCRDVAELLAKEFSGRGAARVEIRPYEAGTKVGLGFPFGEFGAVELQPHEYTDMNA